MIISVIKYQELNATKNNIMQSSALADGIELRLDYAPKIDLNELSILRNQCHLPIIFTLRKKSQGGYYNPKETQRLQDILALCALNPDYFDLEYDISRKFVADLKIKYPKIKLICSYHNFTETPADLMPILQSMQHKDFHIYKIATTAHNTIDSLNLMKFIYENYKKYNLTGICMGADGQCTRILSAVIGNTLHYASLDESQATAPGQLTLNELLTIYSFKTLNRDSKIYALLGDPINLSEGHILHNQNMRISNLNAVYIKLRVTPKELQKVIMLCRQLPFFGFSITMPLKEEIIPLLDKIDTDSKPIRAINSIVLENEQLVGFNTDGLGAIQAIMQHTEINDKTIVILGAGGAARAIAYEASQNNAHVIILNRDIKRAEKLATEFGCHSGALAQLSNLNYDIVINTLPITIKIKPLSNSIAMDIVYNPKHTKFLNIAKKANCKLIFGYEMFVNHATLTFIRWTQPAPK